MSIAVVGAGFTGAVIARELAEAGNVVHVFEKRNHVAGNCHTERDPATGIRLHVYGPHAFHTSNQRVIDYVQKWDQWLPFEVRTKAEGADGRIYSFPINLHTINQFYGENFRPEEARQFLAGQRKSQIYIQSFEDQAMAHLGPQLYENFMKGYTMKQWGIDPKELPASILKRLPQRYTYDDRYFDDTFQALPRNGYTAVVENILHHPNIRVHLEADATQRSLAGYMHVFWTGPLDDYFDHVAGRLAYRTLRFEKYTFDQTWQGVPVMNFCGAGRPYTRCTEHKLFTPWEQHDKSVIYYEYSSLAGPADEPYYPIRLVNDKAILSEYETMAYRQKNVTFAGRLGTYRYLDMHVAIREALEAADKFLGRSPPNE